MCSSMFCMVSFLHPFSDIFERESPRKGVLRWTWGAYWPLGGSRRVDQGSARKRGGRRGHFPHPPRWWPPPRTSSPTPTPSCAVLRSPCDRAKVQFITTRSTFTRHQWLAGRWSGTSDRRRHRYRPLRLLSRSYRQLITLHRSGKSAHHPLQPPISMRQLSLLWLLFPDSRNN